MHLSLDEPRRDWKPAAFQNDPEKSEIDPTDGLTLPQSEVLLLTAPPPPQKEPIGLSETLAVLSGEEI